MELNFIELLKNEVEKAFGRRILSSSDCQNLCSDILRSNNIKISFNTIRRFFNLMKADSQPSIYTLNSLSSYCGFASFEDFRNEKKINGVPNDKRQEEILLNFLILFFRQIEVCKKDDHTYLSIVQQTILHLEHYPSIIDRFQKEVAKTKNGQSFYFEEFVYIDKLNAYYGSGLKYYLNEKKSKEAQIFGYSLLCYKSWLVNDNEGFIASYDKMVQYEIDPQMAPCVLARYFAAQLFYNDIYQLEDYELLNRIRQLYLSMIHHKENGSCVNSFEIILSEALVLVAKYEEALFYIDEILKKVKRNVPSYIDIAIYENICLLRAIAFARTGKKLKAREILQDINPYKFSFLSKQFMNILYLSVKQLVSNKDDEQVQIEYLIRQTGFVKLSFSWRHAPFLLNSL